MVSVTFQGEVGAYSDMALRRYFESRGMRNVEPMPCKSFDQAVRAVEDGDAHYAFIPIENTLEGTIDEALHVLLQSDLFIVGEMRFKVDHCLIGHPGASAEGVQKVFSHPQALKQCRDYIVAHDLEAIPTNDTAGAVREVKARGNTMEAAIASEAAADAHGMQVLRRGLQSREHNFTRFLALSGSEYKPHKDDGDFLTTCIFGVRHTPGALVQALQCFSDRDIQMTKLESRPRPDRPWTYQFLVDFEGKRDDDHVKEALADLVAKSHSLQVMGSYPKWQD